MEVQGVQIQECGAHRAQVRAAHPRLGTLFSHNMGEQASLYFSRLTFSSFLKGDKFEPPPMSTPLAGDRQLPLPWELHRRQRGLHGLQLGDERVQPGGAAVGDEGKTAQGALLGWNTTKKE